MIVRSEHAVEKLEQIILIRLLRGEFSTARRLPSRAQMVREFGVCANTVGAAIGRLVARGLCLTRAGCYTEPIELIRSIDPRTLLDVIEHARVAADGLELLMEVLELLRVVLVDASGQAAARRAQVHLLALQEFLSELETESAPGAAPGLDARDEFRLWRIVAGATGSVAVTATVNSLRSLWLRAAVLRGVSFVGNRGAAVGLANAVSGGQPASACEFAARLLAPRRGAVEAGLLSQRGQSSTGPPSPLPPPGE